jgi:hypothetical protein
MAKMIGTKRGHEIIRRFKGSGGAKLRAVVVTMTVADCAAISEFWLSAHVVACAGDVHETFTNPVNPFTALTVIALVNVAVWPAVTVCEPCPAATLNEKSGGPVTVKFTELEVTDVGVTLTTVMG